MDYLNVSFVPRVCEDTLRLFSHDPDTVAENLFFGLYSGPEDEDSIKRALFGLDTLFGESLDEKIITWTEDRIYIEDIRKLNLSKDEECLLAFRLENASVNIPRLLGSEDFRLTYEIGIHAADKAVAVQWALTLFWRLTRDAYFHLESMYLSDMIEDRKHQ